MIFKKTAVQGNFILSNGNQILFKDSRYETKDEAEIAQLSAIYEVVGEDEAEIAPAEKDPVPVAIAQTGMKSSATITSVTK